MVELPDMALPRPLRRPVVSAGATEMGFQLNFKTAKKICVCNLAAPMRPRFARALTLLKIRGRRESRVPIAPMGPVQQKARG